MNKAVRSVECYLLPSCVFVMGQHLKKKKNFFLFFFWIKQNDVNMDKSQILFLPMFVWRERELVETLGEKMIYQ